MIQPEIEPRSPKSLANKSNEVPQIKFIQQSHHLLQIRHRSFLPGFLAVSLFRLVNAVVILVFRPSLVLHIVLLAFHSATLRTNLYLYQLSPWSGWIGFLLSKYSISNHRSPRSPILRQVTRNGEPIAIPSPKTNYLGTEHNNQGNCNLGS